MINLSFTIKKPNGKIATIRCETDGKHLYRGGAIIKCSCNTDEPVAYVFDGEIVYCPSCYSTSLNVTLIDSVTDIYLFYIGVDFNTMQPLFKLSATLPYNEWLKVSEYFVKLTSEDVDLEYPLDYVGWVTSVPSLVELALDIPFEKCVANRDVEAELLERIGKEDNTNLQNSECFDLVDKLHEVFSVVETPYGEFDLTGGLVVENPLFRPNEHGNGEYWVVVDDEIWYVRNNYRDGDNLRFNNVLVDGDLKAIGKVVSFDEDVMELLEKLMEVNLG